MEYDLAVFYSLNSFILPVEVVVQTDCSSSTNTARLVMRRKLTVSGIYKQAYQTYESLPENPRQSTSQRLGGE